MTSNEGMVSAGASYRPRPQDGPEGKPGVESALDALDKSVEVLSSHIEDLCHRLTPVLRESAEDKSPKLKSIAGSTIGARITETREKIEYLYEMVREHTHRLDI